MEGRLFRRQADPHAHFEITGRGGRATTSRAMLGTAVAIIAAALLVSTLMMVTVSVANLGVATAKAAKCKGATRGPRQVSPNRARQAAVCLINKKRRNHGLKVVHSKPALRKAGTRHSKYMQRHNCFAHQCAGEKDLVARILATSYLPCNCTWRVGETLAWGNQGRGSPRAIVKAWMHSPAHRHVLLDRQLRNVGVGLVWGSPSNRRARAATYTADFGYKRG
ncbi:MAG: CAP domain-containing protein [Actinomycetota bacterium]